MKCNFETIEASDGWRTVRCHRCETTARIPDEGQRIIGNCLPGWGDWFAYYIARFTGITKADLSRWLGKDCGCGGRQEKLNTLGNRIAKLFQ